MINVLGLDTRIFDQVSVIEKKAYKTSTIALFIVVGMSLLANGYMGMMLFGSWLAAVPFALFFGFIQFSIIRIALITLLSKPLAESKVEFDTPEVPVKSGVWNKLKAKSSKLRLASFLRLLFVGLIALTISFPLSSLLMLPKAMEIEADHRIELNQSNHYNKAALNEIQHTHFPFLVFQELLLESSFKFLLILTVCLVYAPLILVSRLRYNDKFEYLEKARQEMLKLVAIDYDETIEQAQYALNQEFPKNKKKLKDLSIYADAPINSIYKNETKHTIGNKIAFNQFIQSIE
jgi:hypothetical protein